VIHILETTKLMCRQKFLKTFSIVVVLFLMFFNYSNSFISRYDVGNNLDDKTVILLSSQYNFFTAGKYGDAFENIFYKCSTESKNSNLCIERYSYRANTLGNYLLPGMLMNSMVDINSNNFNESLSKAFFIGFSAVLAIVFSYILFVMYRMNTHASLFVLVSFMIVSFANPYLGLGAINFSKISTVFFSSLGDGYLPMIYVPRGAVSYLLVPLILSIVYKHNKLLVFTLLLSGVIHLGYSVIFTCIALISSIFNAILVKDNKKIIAPLFGLLISLIVMFKTQSIHNTDSIISLNIANISFNDLKLSISYVYFSFYSILFLSLFMIINKPIIKYIVLILVISGLIETLSIFHQIGVLASDNISQRMMGSFSYVHVSMFMVLLTYIIKSIKVNYQKKQLVVLAFVFFWILNLNFGYVQNKLSSKFNFITYSKKFNNSVEKTYKIKSDITLFLDKRSTHSDNPLWLTPDNNSIDLDKIKKMEISDLNVDNEFLVFLYIYVNSEK